MEVIDRRPVERRRYEGPAMAHARFGPGDVPTLERLLEPGGMAPEALADLMQTVVTAGRADTQS